MNRHLGTPRESGVFPREGAPPSHIPDPFVQGILIIGDADYRGAPDIPTRRAASGTPRCSAG
jgi:hypothetical protein